ncbi:MAG: ATP-dependent helicase [Bacteroidetes bacterium]|nr:ATP-dependent helicase [Bacteroidota bacterium]
MRKDSPQGSKTSRENFFLYDFRQRRLQKIIRKVLKSTDHKGTEAPAKTGREISRIKSNLLEIHDLEEPMKTIYETYESELKRQNAFDFDDLIEKVVRLFRQNPAVLNKYQTKYSHVLVDEYQDTNHIQAKIVKGLAQYSGNVMVVGDDAQSIYSFRGASFRNIMDFPKLFDNVQVIKIEENYRSVQTVLDFANHIYDGAIEKYTKVLYTRKKGGALPYIVATANANMQSKFIVEKILELREEGIILNDIAVLFRSSFFSFDLEIELTKANIPFQKFGGMKFIETSHIKDVLAFLRIASNPKDIISWYRVLLLHEGVGSKSAQRILDELATARITIASSPRKDDKNIIQKKNLVELFVLLYKIHTINIAPTEKVQMVYDYYYPLFKDKYDDFNKRKKDLEIFLNISENYHSLDSLLADMAIEPMIDSMIDIDATDKEDEYLTLSTIHSAKGLEWHSVFIIHVIDGYFPSARSAEKLETLEEERRLMYVASTRAKQNLFVTYPMNMYDREAGTTLSKPSRFISDISPDKAEGWLVEDEF